MRPPVRQVSQSVNIPSPVGGLNASEAVVSMQPTDAIIMQNFFPQPYGVSVRKGFREHQTLPLANPIESLIDVVSAIDNEFVIGSEETLFAASGGVLYDVSAPGGVPVAVVTGLGTNLKANRFQHVNLSQGGDSYSYCVNGVNNPVVIQYPNTVTRLIPGNGVTPWTINNVDPATFINVITYKRSLWFTQFNSSSGWYLDPGLLWGDGFEFDFGPWMTRGGYLVALATWSVDDSNNTQSRLVALTSAGEAIVFEGEDPTDFTTWLNIGTYYISPPLGRRCFAKHNSDLIILTQQGVVSMFDVSRGEIDELFSQGNGRVIQQLISTAALNYGNRFGWDILVIPRGNQIWFNIPSSVDTNYTQLVLNTITKAWARFVNMPCFCMELYLEQPMFALEHVVYEGWVGNRDRVGADGLGGEAIEAICQQAYNYLETPSQAKHIKMFKPVFITDGEMTYKAAINLDFSFEGVYGLIHAQNEGSSLWDVALWDAASSQWSQALSVSQQWVGAYGIGHAVSIKLRTSSTRDVLWVSTQLVFEVGGLI